MIGWPDYHSLDDAFLFVEIVAGGMLGALLFLVLGWSSLRRQRRWILPARAWLRAAAGLSGAFLLFFIWVVAWAASRDSIGRNDWLPLMFWPGSALLILVFSVRLLRRRPVRKDFNSAVEEDHGTR